MDLDSDVEEIANPSIAQRVEAIPVSSLSKLSTTPLIVGAPPSAMATPFHEAPQLLPAPDLADLSARQYSSPYSASSLTKPASNRIAALSPNLATVRPSTAQTQDPLQVFTAGSLINKSSTASEEVESSDRQDVHSHHYDTGSPPRAAALLATLLADLRKIFPLDFKPAFAVNNALGNTGLRPGDVRSVVLATEDGKYPQAPIKRAELIYRAWNNRVMFATVELDGSLHIVKSVTGNSLIGKSGATAFRHWQGHKAGFSKNPIVFEDREPTKRVAEKSQLPATDWSSGPASGSSKKILRASKPIRHSDSGIVYDWAAEAEDTHSHPVSRGDTHKTTRLDDGFSTDSTESSYGDEGNMSLGPVAAMLPKKPPVKMEPRENNSLLTPATSIPRGLPSSQGYTPKHVNESLEDRVKAKGLEMSEIERQLIQERAKGKTWQVIENYFKDEHGIAASFATWCSRHKRITNQKTLPRKPPGPAKRVIPSKRARETIDSSDSVDSSDDETEDTKFRRPAKRTFVPSKIRRASFLERFEAPASARTSRQRVSSESSIVAPPVATPTFVGVLSEADQKLLRWKDISRVPWADIRAKWEKLTGENASESTLRDRYRNLTADPNTHPPAHRRRSQPDEIIPISSLSAQNNGTQPLRLRSVNSNFPPATPGYFQDSSAAMGFPMPGTTVPAIPGLDESKISRTTLRVGYSGSSTTIKLSSCTTMSNLFYMVASACGITSRSDAIWAIVVTYPWFPIGSMEHRQRVVLALEDTYEFFLEAVNDAPCWKKENGKCNLDVEVAFKEISGEAAGGGSFGSWPAA